MKQFVKILSIILIFALLVNMLPMSIFAEQLQDNVIAELSPAKPDASTSILHEITQKRTQYTKEFLLSNGLHLAVAYPEPVHYEKDGAWEAIDNTLTAKTDGTYINTAGRWQVAFPQQFGKNQSVTVTKDGYTLSFGMPQRLTNAGASLMSASADSVAEIQAESSTAQIQAAIDVTAEKETAEYPETVVEKLASRLTYESIHSGTDVVYDLTGEKVKESVVMKSYDSTLQGYRYTLNVGSMVPVLAEEGHITFYDETQTNVIMVMPAPYMVDAAMEMSVDVGVSLTGNGSEYTLTYTLPTDWLAFGDRQWPVILDPVIQASLQTANIRDASVAENKTFGYTSPVLETGYYTGEGKQRTYLKYQNLPALTSADMVVAATVTLYKFVTSDSAAPIEVHKVLGSWESESLTWSNKPACDTIVEDFVNCKEARYYKWDVTDIVRQWYATGNNYGMMFKASDTVENGGANNFKQFYSSDYSDYPTYKPALTIMFRNSNGLESYWDYTSASAGRAGTGYVNNYTGNLVWTHSDMGFPGNRMPVSISHIYNANDAASNSFGMGYGWRTNYNQRVYRWSANSNYYVWEDSDGTKHYFPYDSSSGAYKDEDGLSLTLTNTGSGSSTYVITDKYGNTSHFNASGYLTKLQNNQATKSAITITYKSAAANLIDTITDGAGRVYSFTYIDYLLDRISFKGTGSTELTYTTYTYTSSNLTKITDKDGKYATYAYNSGHILSAATDVDGYKLSYTYTLSSGTFAPCRVASIREYDGSVSGGHLTFAYANNQTTVSDQVNGTKLVYQFNNWGNTVSVQDDEGRAQFMEFDRDVWNDNTGKGNQLNLSSKLQASVVNLIANTGIEIHEQWKTVGSATASDSTTNCYMGNKSLYVTKSTSGAYGGVYLSAVAVPAGKTYTFSCYVKAVGCVVHLQAKSGTQTITGENTGGNDLWQRLQVSYKNTSASAQNVEFHIVTKDAGSFYLDCLQREYAEKASRYNMIGNGDFHIEVDPDYLWVSSRCTADDGTKTLSSSAISRMNPTAFQITGDYVSEKSISQTIPVNGSAGDSFVFAGWAKGNSASLANLDSSTGKEFALKLTFQYTDGSTKTETVSFNPDVDNWQYAAAAAVAEKAYSSVTLKAVYSKNANTVYFDGLQLYKEEFGNAYTYDDEGNVISTKDLQRKTATYEYVNNNLTKAILPTGAELTYTYDSYHNVISATSEEGVVYSFTYDTYGNNTKVSITSGGAPIAASASYTANGNFLARATDALDKVTTYSYNNSTGVLEWVKYPEDTDSTRTNYTYDSMYRAASATAKASCGYLDAGGLYDLCASYTYADDRLTSVTTPTTTYSFTYGNFSLRSAVKIGTRTLASYSYASGNNRLNKLTYGNGDYVQYTYDAQGRITKLTYEDGATVTYGYNTDGDLVTVTDSATGKETTYFYDLQGQLVKKTECGNNDSTSVTHTVDSFNRITHTVENTNGYTRYIWHTYDGDNRLLSTQKGWAKQTNSYDAYGRNSAKTVTFQDATVLTTTYGFHSAGTKATGQIGSVRNRASGYDVTYTYTYDDNGNILSVSDGTYTTTYEYDTANQLIRENNPRTGYTYTWAYDQGGNIENRRTYLYTTGAVLIQNQVDMEDYTYGNSEWGDLLTVYDGRAFAYDTVGNIVSDGQWNYTWKHGRQLASMSKGTTTWTFTYDANGMRTGRTNGSKNYSYYYDDGKLISMSVDGKTLYFSYTLDGVPFALVYQEEVYIYVRNLQGDIVAILDTAGNLVVEYSYDAWGNLLTCTGSMASTLGLDNPLRYRGYVYDTETGLYYLQSRYYNPKWGRFINADAFPSTGQSFTGNNMFAYCGNNPVSRADDCGEFWHLVVGGVIGGIIGAVSSAASGGDGVDILIGAVAGAAGGVLAASGAGVVVQALGSAAISMASNAASQVNHIAKDKSGETKFDMGDMLFDGAIGLACGAWGGNGASYGNSGGITAAGKQLFKRGFFNAQARSYYAKVAHNMGGEYVFKPLLKSLGKNAVGSAIVTGKNLLIN